MSLRIIDPRGGHNRSWARPDKRSKRDTEESDDLGLARHVAERPDQMRGRGSERQQDIGGTS